MRRSIKTAIIVPLLIALVLGVTAMAVVVSLLSSNTTTRLTNENITANVDKYSGEFEQLCQDVYGTVAAVAPLITASVDSEFTEGISDPRGYVIDMISDVVMSNDAIVAAWTGWEPNAYDGLDADYAGQSFYDASGRFVPYVYKSGGGVSVEALADYETGDFYVGARDTGKPYMTDPYPYSVGGTEILMCSISIPLVKDGKVAGVFGADIDLSDFTSLMRSASILGEGYMVVLSPGGYTAAHPNEANIMMPWTDIAWMQDNKAQFETLFANGGTFDGKAFSDVLGANMLFQSEAMSIGDTGRNWLVIGVVPESTATAATQQMLWIIIAIGAALFAVVGVTAFVITKRSLAPLGPLTSFLRQAGETGDIHLRPEDIATIEKYAQQKNELGQCISGAAGFVAHVNRIGEELESVAGGDLTTDVTLLSDRDAMGLSLKKMLENLNAMFQDIQSASGQVSAGSNQVAHGAQALAAGSTEQAASIQELSSSISEIAAQTHHNAETAESAAKLANTIKDNAETGSRQMGEMIQSVKEINEASQSISKVIKTIDDIAFQTNILALNAAVEAARAGQHGKGFAVVAEEVRNLAAKSAEAAKDTESLIASSISKAEQGVHIAEATAASLSEIVSGINESSSLVMEIARASEEQSQNISQINSGIDQVAQVVQQNSATAEESAAASEEMSGQSETLQELVSHFRLKDQKLQPLSIGAGAGPAPKRLTDDNGFGKY